MTVSTQSKVGEIAAEYPLATRVFARYDIDFCCGGGRTIDEISSKKHVDPHTLIREIEQELQSDAGEQTNWSTVSSDTLIEHILNSFHKPLREELPRLVTMAEKVNKVHGDKDPERFRAIVDTLRNLQSEMMSHMMKEEQILFPIIRSGRASAAQAPISVMEHEHQSAADALRQLRELTNDYQVPRDACNTWRALWHGLADLESATHQHIHLENNILFPRSQN